jgi:hypothetical protein
VGLTVQRLHHPRHLVTASLTPCDCFKGEAHIPALLSSMLYLKSSTALS